LHESGSCFAQSVRHSGPGLQAGGSPGLQPGEAIASSTLIGRNPTAGCNPRIGSRGVTLVEILITVTIVAMLSGMAMLGIGAMSGARMKRTAVQIAGAVRTAYAHANATSKPVRLVFDFERRAIVLEEGSSALLRVKRDKSGGAEAATEAEAEAHAAADAILKGPRAPKPSFKPARAFGWSEEEGAQGKELPPGIRIHSVETPHTEEPELSERAYVYFWPGGTAERAAIIVTRGDGEEDEDSDFMTILVSPLTGKTEIKLGRHTMPRPRNDAEESEREDTGS
jgi:general secretion pathway protein H